MGSPFKAGANALLIFERTKAIEIRRSLDDPKYMVDKSSYFGDCSDADEDAEEWGSVIVDSRTTTPLIEVRQEVVETLEVYAKAIRDKAAQTDQTPRSYNLQLGPNTDLLPLKCVATNPKFLPDWIRPYSRAKCTVYADDFEQAGVFVLGWMIQSPWKPARKALGTRFAGNLLLTGPGNPPSEVCS